ncbi:penicillin-binding protein 1C [Fulvivirga sediminis]|uniref:peptidoglycan glycosyltransferase n=1 Tax=Fulvivirga sediminis TaxID=2803949 RepID=A0A937F745_9BACT|nr:penicillin-binding protein 1C [Fulvivirga sediminis]MBL3656257.1 penicillin-binding protein 1C [Fulvivirga sediminis]
MKRHFKKYKYYWIGGIVVLLVAYSLILPSKLFSDPYSTVLTAADGQLLSASVAPDGQWRFPALDSVPDKYATAVTYFEDESFYWHPGVNPFSMVRATWQNINAGHVVSGGSTITMQVMRLSRKDKPRSIWEKVIEMVLATRLELKYSKEEILAIYASHAPYGGNVVGLRAATWRYFNREPDELSWGEAALLAVLPNSPALIHPGRNRDDLEGKRNRLLQKLRDGGIIDELTCSLAMAEPIPEEPLPLPQKAPHLLTRAINDGKAQQNLNTTINTGLQNRVSQILQTHYRHLKGNEVHNAAALVADVRTGQVLAYVGNVSMAGASHDSQVDVINAPRSTGSILKPFLYAAMMDEGQLLPKMLVPDVPVFFSGFAPKNFSKTYDGAVPADRALARSLNVPAVQLLRQYRYEKFHSLLKELGMTTLTHSPDHYGLSLALGGAEGTLWDISGMYAGLSRTLGNFYEHTDSYKYATNNFMPLTYIEEQREGKRTKSGELSAASIYHTLTAMLEVYRPVDEGPWQLFESSQKIAWKTGTSFGYRDAWAVGTTADYVVGVWVGNADGEGRPGLTGVEAAAPIMFDIFDLLPKTEWFKAPSSEMVTLPICRVSGYQASEACPVVDQVEVLSAGQNLSPCPFHHRIHLDHNGYRVNSNCESVNNMEHVSWFVLPPVQEYYYRSNNPSYKKLPPFRSDCVAEEGGRQAMEIIYPKANAEIFIPREIDSRPGSAVLEVAHRRPETTIYWHLNDQYLGETKRIHQMSINPGAGDYTLTIVDEAGETLTRHFKVISE